MKKLVLILSIASTLSGCAATHKGTSAAIETNLQQGNIKQAISVAIENAGLDKQANKLGDQLWGMQTASLLRMDKQYQQSNLYFDLIEDVMYQEDTENLIIEGAETLGSIVTNDTFLSYEQTVYDSIMVNTYKAINFMAQGDFTNARVEWNRSDDRQRRAADYFAKKINKAKEKILAKKKQNKAEKKVKDSGDIDKSVSQSNIILATKGADMSTWQAYSGYINPFATYMHGLFFMLKAQDKADVGKAVDSFKRVNGIARNSATMKTLALAKDIQQGKKKLNNIDKVWVIFENAQMAKKREIRVDLPLFLVSNNVAYVGIALPQLAVQPDTFGSLKVQGVETEVVADMDKIIKAEFKEEFPLILTREIIRTTAKTIMQKQLNDKNPLLGFGAGVLQALSTQADIRTWSLLPKNFQVAVIDKPKNNKIILETGGFSAPLTIDLTPNKNAIIYVKSTYSQIQPSVEVIYL